MKFNIEGFDQQKLIDYGLDIVDAALLRYFIDFRDSTNMRSRIIDGKQYYWVKYEGVIEELPILKLNKADSVYRRLQKMVKANILESYTLKQGGVYSYYKTGENYISLVSNSKVINRSDKNPNTSDVNPNNSDKNPYCSDTNPNNSDVNPERKTLLPYPSTKNKSTISNKGAKVDNFNNFEQRTYDYQDLEKKLLGWE